MFTKGDKYIHFTKYGGVNKGEVGGRSKLADVVVQRGDLLLAGRVGDAVITQFPSCGGRVVVGGGDDGADAPDLATGLSQAFEGLRAGDFVHQVTIDIEDGGAVFFGVDYVFVPEFVIQRATHECFLVCLVEPLWCAGF